MIAKRHRRRRKEIKELVKQANELILDGHTMTDACHAVGIAQSVFYKNAKKMRLKKSKTTPDQINQNFTISPSTPESYELKNENQKLKEAIKNLLYDNYLRGLK